MDGFFSKKSFEVSVGRKFSCVSCGLYKECNSPKLKPSGEFHKKIMNIGKPSQMDDDQNGVFLGKFGRILKREYARFGIDMEKDCINLNALQCFPKNDLSKAKKTNAINACRRFVIEAIETYKPHIIVFIW